jgi:hypothetical protein
MRCILWCFCLLLAAYARADYQTYDASYVSNEDDIRLQQFLFSSQHERFDLNWPYLDEKDQVFMMSPYVHLGTGSAPEVSGADISYQFVEASLAAKRKFSAQLAASVKAGVFYFKNKTTERDLTTASYEAQVMWRHSDAFTHALSMSRSFLAQEGAVTAGYNTPIWALSLSQLLTWRLHEKWKLSESFRKRWFEDHNEREDIDMGAMYALSTYPVWLWIGLGYNYSHFKSVSLLYWSPNEVSTVGLRFDASVPFADKWAAKCGGQVGQTKESKSDAAVSDYIKLALQRGERESKQFEIYWIDSRSTRADGDWSAQTVGLNYSSGF